MDDGIPTAYYVATTDLLTKFYEYWLKENMGRRRAFEEAQRWMRSQPGYGSPYYWAGFVLVE